jgi:RimJ/RimL family protein N-acetyltransferase
VSFSDDPVDRSMIEDSAGSVERSAGSSSGTPDDYRVDEVRPPSRRGRWAELAPVGADSVEYLYQLAIDESIAFRWRFGGTVPTRAQFESSLWAGVLAQFVVVEKGERRGLVVAYDADLRHGFAYMGAIMEPARQATGLGVEAMVLFIHYLFGTWNFRKLYMELPEYNLEWMANRVGKGLVEEGRLRQHFYYAGRWWDKLILAIYRDDFYRGVGRLVPSWSRS